MNLWNCVNVLGKITREGGEITLEGPMRGW